MKEHIEDILVGGRPMTKNEIKIKELQDRIDKAIEYIEKDLKSYWNNLPLIAIDLEELLKILKGSDKE